MSLLHDMKRDSDEETTQFAVHIKMLYCHRPSQHEQYFLNGATQPILGCMSASRGLHEIAILLYSMP